MCRQRNNPSSTTNGQGNKVIQKEKCGSPEISLKVTEDYYLNGREFEIALMEKLKDIQGNSERQFKELRNKINRSSTLPKRLKL